MSRLEAKKPPLFISEPLTRDTVCQSLLLLSRIFKSSYGPAGRLKQLHNGVGGCVCTTSQSSALLRHLSVRDPVLRVLTASVQNHVSRFSDCGLFTAILCCSLIENFRSLNVAPGTVVKITRHLLSLCMDYLKSEACGCRVSVDFSSVETLVCLVRSVLTSKPACMLDKTEVEHLTTLVLKAFLFTVPCHVETNAVLGKCVIVPVKGRRVMDSTVLPGLLIETAEIQLGKPLAVKRTGSNMIKTALFCVSMSGDSFNPEEGTIAVHHGISLEMSELNQLLNVGKQLVNDGVGLVVCQKVIHPSLKQYLKENHVMAVDRAGLSLMEPLSRMTGSKPVASIHSLSPGCYGSLKDVSIERVASKHFVHLIPEDTVICSLILCNRSETAWDELKRVCETAEHVLQLTMKEPLALLGGGCTETHLASYIRYKSSSLSTSTFQDLGCSQTQYHLVADGFCRSLESVARSLNRDGGGILRDVVYGHCWFVPSGLPSVSNWSDVVSTCGCGINGNTEDLSWRILEGQSCSPVIQGCPKEPSVKVTDFLALDCFAAKCSGLQVALETANLVLDLSYIIEDQN
ncbi:McKusick-Kaufman/Bardet-Biedl syndromes putative chaperonin isoform X1 [Corapipo altera]|uniref:McKusick-Kaufman/Bardet-Biedl syndromes putative chaperonin isoform X1 n=1 Tax=Corapipo altera TaxID=415028 RepID=UPI000FD65231|nr:McKusick-Kaufman/Bardet-Biedl syndromes putative chaperonin isoform X1 [Corapipo altera]XP_027509603.1 McKusick-Kaufman/Bardet-Biedl syndromes putative chaperonin isoform X1 [Corapipo altera]XP_027509604.1 McKusick-Kaufman/Bardet-Biedl syndromes putative chaperonin isoform X1 [Corapipo altera]XP_027509605.1 McKusick-Kaufman/Bardet-Biedl syndromes putative chaperonin isoform X1 [Corapipo altera]XP_027509606.1 McKusick-Kaufman/Bardet-Biedl syndromes putative chaperonin isoform X1 [Corapipo alt